MVRNSLHAFVRSTMPRSARVNRCAISTCAAWSISASRLASAFAPKMMRRAVGVSVRVIRPVLSILTSTRTDRIRLEHQSQLRVSGLRRGASGLVRLGHCDHVTAAVAKVPAQTSQPISVVSFNANHTGHSTRFFQSIDCLQPSFTFRNDETYRGVLVSLRCQRWFSPDYLSDRRGDEVYTGSEPNQLRNEATRQARVDFDDLWSILR